MRTRRAHAKLIIVLGLSVLTAAGAVTAVVAVGGDDGSASAPPTTGAYAPITVSRQVVPIVGGGIARRLDAGVQQNLSTNLSRLPGRHRYRVTVANISNVGFIDTFEWYPPTGVRITRVTGSSTGRCALRGVTGFGGNQFKSVLLHPNITCESVNLKPPSCTCLGDGGSVTISFLADGELTLSGVARMVSARLVFDPIPSYLQPATSPQNGTGSEG
jgi:hypothetical protein